MWYDRDLNLRGCRVDRTFVDVAVCVDEQLSVSVRGFLRMQPSKVVKVLYFSAIPIGKADNGGSIVCRYHVQRLAGCGLVELHVASIQTSDLTNEEEKKFVESVGASYHNICSCPLHRPSSLAKKFIPAWRWPYLLEWEALNQSYVDKKFFFAVAKLKPDIVVIDYLLTARFVPALFSLPVRILTISLNRESEFHAEMRRAGRLRANVSTSIIAQWRLSHFERSTIRNSDAIVVLSEQDRPASRRAHARTTVLEPILDSTTGRWRCSINRDILFVGRASHHPNFLAIKWLAERFAPALAQRCPEARIRVVGAAASEVQTAWKRKNIEYIGDCDERTLEGLFGTCRLFIGPIENTFGAKMKILQCLASGMPVLATSGALTGVPYKTMIPQFTLDEPHVAAKLAAELVCSDLKLTELSQVLLQEHSRLLRSRNDSWIHLLSGIMSGAPRPLPRRSLLSWLRRDPWDDTSQPWPKKVEVGVCEPSGVATSGFYPLEELNGQPLRWTNEIADVSVGLNQRTLPRSLNFRLWGIGPTDGTVFRILINGKHAFEGQVGTQPMKHTIQLPELRGVPTLLIRLESCGFQSPGDLRKLGVAIKSLALQR